MLYHASNILYVVVLGLAKISAAGGILNLTVYNRGSIRTAPVNHKVVFAVEAVVAAAWMFASIVGLSLQCEHGASTCEGTMDTWVGIFVGDAVTDLAIAGFAASIIWRTKAILRLKVIWYTPYVIRICVIVCSGARLASINRRKLTSDSTISVWVFVVLTQIQIFLALIAAGYPALKRTVLDLVTNFGVSDQSTSNSRPGESYALRYLSRRSKADRSNHSGRWKVPTFSPFTATATGSAVVTGGKQNALEDDDSQKGIVRQDEFDVTVSYDNAGVASDMPIGPEDGHSRPY
ncbi:hypothetical protein LTR85_008623 [Meristemomyces frigidus]|nr:hypothetical protein LTR85_008623 [Meristemomyces frigidus]